MEIGIYLNNTQIRTKYIIDLIFSTSGISYKIFYQTCIIPRMRIAIICDYCEELVDTLTKKGVSCILIPSIIEEAQIFDSINHIDWISSNTSELIPVLGRYKNQNLIGDVLYSWQDTDDPAIDKTQTNNAWIINFGFDIIASIYLMCVNTEALSIQNNDKHSRAQAVNSFLYKNKLLLKPIFNIYIKLFINIFRALTEKNGDTLIQKWFWPNNIDYAACLTHDIDVVTKWSLGKIKDELVNKIWTPLIENSNKWNVLKRFARVLLSILRLENRYWNFDYIIELERKFNFKSTFYFSTVKDTNNGLEYDVTDNRIIKMMKNIIKRGWEIGLHGSYYSYNNLKILRAEKSKLENLINTLVIGTRQHILRFQTPLTWYIQQSTGLLYDCTYGYADHEGFRSGIAFPYYPFDPEKNTRLNILEIPLTVMDGTLSGYRQLKSESAKSELFDLIHNIRTNNGIGCFLWHNKYFDNLDYPGYDQLYIDILQLLNKQNAFVTSGKEIYQWWIAREAIELKQEKCASNFYEWTFQNNGDTINGLTFKIYSPDINDTTKVKITPIMNFDKIHSNKNDMTIIISSVPKHQSFNIKMENSH